MYAIVENNQIGAIKMEVKRNEEPKKDFLKKVRKLADKKNIVLIFVLLLVGVVPPKDESPQHITVPSCFNAANA